MLAKVYTATLIGLEVRIIEVEVDISRGERRISIVGLPDKAVQEAQQRIITAFRNSNIDLGPGNKVINLAPADLPKSGPSYDLPMAFGLLVAIGIVKPVDLSKTIFVGELALDGSLRAVEGVLPMADEIKRQGFENLFLPISNFKEANLVPGLNVYPVKNLMSLVRHFNGSKISMALPYSIEQDEEDIFDNDFKFIKGQYKVKRAMEIAAAGGHHMLMNGVPGSGKTFLAKCFSSILPKPSFQESIEITRIYSILGKISKEKPLITVRPFRSPHHTASQIALVGGGSHPRPGEISLAHRGVLFLDELPEFSNKTLEVLRQPMEDKVVNISRAAGTITYPANFQLLAAMNPCKCGFFGDEDKQCICSSFERRKYVSRISGPIMDRIDIQTFVPKVKYRNLVSSLAEESSSIIRNRVEAARTMQVERFLETKLISNSDMDQKEIVKFLSLNKESKVFLRDAVSRFDLSARGYFRVLKVARTVADLAGSKEIETEHIAEALSFRLNSEI